MFIISITLSLTVVLLLRAATSMELLCMGGVELVYAEAGVGHNHAAAVMEVDLQRIKTVIHAT